ncbi:MAG: hypothetical protein E6258_03745 [Campylobacter ureolyticus]|uniref:hypothetical protein n=1 Tax=Campylobacter ureolyticus TaxID=827 RepID=UPI0022B363C2|nr:hypothetical protein [Campylobacter ureolyticus]MCZ6103289.1 hypothetical protein [Campylobacter ureolyticus]MDU4981703.1 hypothetical protein [Campylobacter ureolyticus]
MRYVIFIALIIFILIILSLENLSKKIKALIISILVLIALFGYFFEINSEEKSSNLDAIITAFLQGQTIKCGKVDANLTNFDYLPATKSLSAKREAPENFKNLIFDIKDCKVLDGNI